MSGQTRLGYTAIELLVVVSIIALLSGLSLAYYNNFTQQKILENETRKLIDTFEAARSKASAGDKGSCTDFYGTVVKLGKAGTSDNGTNQTTDYFSLSACCNTTCDNSSFFYRSNFPQNIVFASPSNNTLIKFSPLNRGVDITPQIIVKDTVSNQCRQITISQAGTINEQKVNCP